MSQMEAFCPSCLDLEYARLRDPAKYMNLDLPESTAAASEPMSHLTKPPRLGQIPPQPVYPFASWNHSYRGHKTSASDIEQTAVGGCKACSVLSKAIRHHVPNFSPGDKVIIKADDDQRTPLILEVWPDYRLNSLEHRRSEVELELFSVEGSPSPWPTVRVARDLPPSTSSSTSLNLAKSWIHECVSNHADCSFSKTALPTRVIDIGSKGNMDPRLLVSNGEFAEYAALSYCWGGSSVLTTTRATFTDRLAGINFGHLPKTIQDAVVITQNLGIRYLWVDSLCIVQDDADDWAEEAAKMKSVYANSLVTICAERADDNEGGCFLPQGVLREPALKIECPGTAASQSYVYSRLKRYRDEWAGEVGHSTRASNTKYVPSRLQTRGWTFQERLLAPRIIHFAGTEMAWECTIEYRCECQASPTPNSQGYKSKFLRNYSPATTYDSVEYRSFKFNWSQIVTDFTHRNLTVGTDRLPAIGGISELMKPDSANDYAAGLWKKDFALHLLWYVPGFSSFNATTSRRHKEYIAPSWSWASVTGPIRYFAPLIHTESKYKIEVEILDIDLVLSGPNPFGSLKDGHIIVRGLLAPTHLSLLQVQLDPGHPFGIRISVGQFDPNEPDPRHTPKGDLCFDVKGNGETNYDAINKQPGGTEKHNFEIKMWEDLYCLMVMYRSEEYYDEVHIIVLRESSREHGAYERVGYLGGPQQMQSWEIWARKATLKTIKII
ncbi:heterokaryon incompatibility protein-domain-containing protein [Leptodontidium sp. MPI-SDFR-AT-0119]|nr:heterokaryon incompatibility protein-domain-containing protein [Leptodontidium sp. MPI-SDFR-AT-0119]